MSTPDLKEKASNNTLSEVEGGRKDNLVLEESRVRNLSQRIRRLLPTSSSSRNSTYDSSKEEGDSSQPQPLEESWSEVANSSLMSQSSPSLNLNAKSSVNSFKPTENLNSKIHEESTELKLEDLDWLTNLENQPKSTRDLINGAPLNTAEDTYKNMPDTSDEDNEANLLATLTSPNNSSTSTTNKSNKSHNPLADLQMDPVQKKRNIDFHINFPSLPLDDILIEDWHCALQKDILITGRMYITQERICFHSNLFGWVNHTIINFKDIVSIQKRSTAFVIPNAIQIITLDQKYFFTSFMSRDSAFTLLYEHWFKKCPNRAQDPNKPISDSADCKDEKCLAEATGTGITTLCKCLQAATSHEGTLNLDVVIPTKLETLFNLVYGADTAFILEHLKASNLEVQVGSWKPNQSRDVTYIKPLTNPLGPKQTHCNCVETIQHQDFEDYCSVEARIQTPDVPSGDAFTVITKTCIMRYKTDQSRLVMTTTLEWSKSSWFKGPIEAGSREGATKSAKELHGDIQKYLDSHPDLVTQPQGDTDDADVHSIKLDVEAGFDGTHTTQDHQPWYRTKPTFRNAMVFILTVLAIFNLLNWWYVLHLQNQIQTHKLQLAKDMDTVKVNPLQLPENRLHVLHLKKNLKMLSEHLEKVEFDLKSLAKGDSKPKLSVEEIEKMD